MFAQFQLVFSIFCVLIAVTRSELSCRNENNQFVDWFVALKPPNEFGFLYVSSQSEDSQWKLSKNIRDNLNIFSVTLNQAYNSKSTGSFFAFYNDQSKSVKGHLNGVINFDKTSGYWLIHSVPHFPTADRYGYPNKGKQNGQSFICVSLRIDNLEEIVDQLLIMKPKVYRYNLPDIFSSNEQIMKKLKNLTNNAKEKHNEFKNISLSTANQTKLIHFGKSPSFENDLYSLLIADNLKSSIKAETWLRTKNKSHILPSYCNSTYKVYNVKQIRLNGKIYKNTQDHSKWAVSDSSTTKFVCIGDINRVTTQFIKGGGSLCLYNDILWELFDKVVVEFEKCNENSSEHHSEL